jgi:hypothetical protein
MADIEFEDKTGQMRDPEDFMRAHKIIVARMVKAGGVPQDVELFMEFTTILEALEIAAAVSLGRRQRGLG